MSSRQALPLQAGPYLSYRRSCLGLILAIFTCEAQCCRSSSVALNPAGVMPELTVGFLLFPGFEVLDVFGPLELFACKPMRAHFNPVFVAEQRGQIESAQDLKVVAEHDFQSCPDLDILVVPGAHTDSCWHNTKLNWSVLWPLKLSKTWFLLVATSRSLGLAQAPTLVIVVPTPRCLCSGCCLLRNFLPTLDQAHKLPQSAQSPDFPQCLGRLAGCNSRASSA